MKHKKLRRGFTLIEVLVVVLIIGILAAIALPLYNRAVLRSRFSALMPIAKAMADSNEAYYLEHGNYASNPQDLPVQGLSEYPTGTELELGSDMDYAYVLARNPKVNANYIVYQKHSANFPGETHCEASKEDPQAISLCEKSLQGKRIGGSLTENYQTYVLTGEGNGITATAAENIAANAVCTEEEVSGHACRIYSNPDGSKTKRTCVEGYNPDPVCTTDSNGITICSGGAYVACMSNQECNPKCTYTTYRTDGGYSECSEFDTTTGKCKRTGLYTEQRCYIIYNPNPGGVNQHSCSYVPAPYEVDYDEDGRKISEKVCNSISCNQITTTTYGEDNSSQVKARTCSTYSDNGEGCSSYSSWGNTDQSYDSNGHLLSSRTCINSGITSDGTCTTFSGGSDYTYDANGKQTSSRTCIADGITSDGACTTYSSGWNSEYDSNGNQTSSRTCIADGITSDGACTTYSSGWNKEYDSNGNTTSSRTCVANSDCSSYSGGNDYTYDSSNREITSRTCGASFTNGQCDAYTAGTNTTYETDGYTKTSCTEWTNTQCTGSWVMSEHRVGDSIAKCNGTVLADGSCSGGWYLAPPPCSGNICYAAQLCGSGYTVDPVTVSCVPQS